MTQCHTEGCQHDSKNREYCGTCRSRKYRKADEVRYFLNNLRRSATRRHIEFTLELEEFRAWAKSVNFQFGGGVGPSKDSVDRKENDKGYHIWNIQKLTMSQNSSKYQNHDRKHGKVWKPIPTPVEF